MIRPASRLDLSTSRRSSLYSGFSKSADLLPGPIRSTASLSKAALFGANNVLSPASASRGISFSSLPSSTYATAACRVDRSDFSETACAMVVGCAEGAVPAVPPAALSAPLPPPPQAASRALVPSAAIHLNNFEEGSCMSSSRCGCLGLEIPSEQYSPANG